MKTAEIIIGESYWNGKYRIVPRSSVVQKQYWQSRGTRVFACDAYDANGARYLVPPVKASEFLCTWARRLESVEKAREEEAKRKLWQAEQQRRIKFLMRRFELAKGYFPEFLGVNASGWQGENSMALNVRFKVEDVTEAMAKELELVADDLRRLTDITGE
jgi:hypothetical protein